MADNRFKFIETTDEATNLNYIQVINKWLTKLFVALGESPYYQSQPLNPFAELKSARISNYVTIPATETEKEKVIFAKNNFANMTSQDLFLQFGEPAPNYSNYEYFSEDSMYQPFSLPSSSKGLSFDEMISENDMIYQNNLARFQTNETIYKKNQEIADKWLQELKNYFSSWSALEFLMEGTTLQRQIKSFTSSTLSPPPKPAEPPSREILEALKKYKYAVERGEEKQICPWKEPIFKPALIQTDTSINNKVFVLGIPNPSIKLFFDRIHFPEEIRSLESLFLEIEKWESDPNEVEFKEFVHKCLGAVYPDIVPLRREMELKFYDNPIYYKHLKWCLPLFNFNGKSYIVLSSQFSFEVYEQGQLIDSIDTLEKLELIKAIQEQFKSFMKEAIPEAERLSLPLPEPAILSVKTQEKLQNNYPLQYQIFLNELIKLMETAGHDYSTCYIKNKGTGDTSIVLDVDSSKERSLLENVFQYLLGLPRVKILDAKTGKRVVVGTPCRIMEFQLILPPNVIHEKINKLRTYQAAFKEAQVILKPILELLQISSFKLCWEHIAGKYVLTFSFLIDRKNVSEIGKHFGPKVEEYFRNFDFKNFDPTKLQELLAQEPVADKHLLATHSLLAPQPEKDPKLSSENDEAHTSSEMKKP